MPHSPTDEQAEAIAAASRRDSPSIMTKAFAGTGKTSTLEMMAHRIQRPALALAFNRKIVEELRPRMPDNFTVKSLNGLGHGAWMRRPGMPSLKLDDRKTGKIVTEVLKETCGGRASAEQWDWTRQLVSRSQVLGLVPRRYHSQAQEFAILASEADFREAAAEIGIPSDEHRVVCDAAREALERDIALALQGQISFDDQVYCPTVLGGSWPRYPCVFIDESQDLSWLNHRMLELVSKDQIVVVGDPLQAIYAFRGADSNSMTSMRDLRTEWQDLRLTLTFRCPKEIVRRQQSHAVGYRAAEGNREGLFQRFEALDKFDELKGGWGVGDLRCLGLESLVVLCRNNGPLMSLAFKLLRRAIGVKMLGRDIAKNLISLSKKICPTDEMLAAACFAAIKDWKDQESSLALQNGREALLDSISDRAECLLAVLESAEARDAGQLRSLLQSLFARDVGQIVLSSIHRSKGLEWSTVLHLDPWRIPSRWAKKAAAAGDQRQMQQELNLRYVCETRTKETLVEANLEDFR